MQDAYVSRAETWARDGVPARPGAWLTTVARRRALNLLRRGRTLEAKLPLLLEPRRHESDRRRRDPRRPSAARLHLLPSRAGARGAGRADAAARVRRRDGGRRARVPRLGVHDGRAHHPREEEDRRAPASPTRSDGGRAARARLDAALTVIHLLYTTGHTAPHGRRARPRRADRARARPRPDAARSCCPPSARPRACSALLLVHRGAARDAHRSRPGA